MLCCFYVAFFLPLSVKFTWKLNTGIGTQLCYLVPLAICWLLKKSATKPLSNTCPVQPLSVHSVKISTFCGQCKKYKKTFTKANIYIFVLFTKLYSECEKYRWHNKKAHLLCFREMVPNTWVNFCSTDSQIDNLWFKCTLRLPIFYTIESIEVY